MIDYDFYDQPWNPDVDSKENQTKPLDVVLNKMIDNKMLQLYTSLPCVVTTVVSNSQVHVQPLLQSRLKTNVLVTLPIIQNVPVMHPRGKNFGIKLPIAVGDQGKLSFMSRSLDSWKSSKGGVPVDPQDIRTHDITDCVYEPGMYPLTDQIKGAAQDLIITNGIATFKVQPGGTFINSNGTNELYDLLVQTLGQLSELAETLNEDTTNTIFGPQPLNNFATYGAIKSAVDVLQSKLTTLKGS